MQPEGIRREDLIADLVAEIADLVDAFDKEDADEDIEDTLDDIFMACCDLRDQYRLLNVPHG